MVDPFDVTHRRVAPGGSGSSDLLVPMMRKGQLVYEPPPLAVVREHAKDQLARLPAGVKRFVHPHRYPVGLESGLFDLRQRLIAAARGELA
jgi:nicotinate phosphoribosyltransferase